MKWSQPAPLHTKEKLEEPIRIATTDYLRAKKRVESEKFAALKLGALNGQTVELAEAEAVLQVCKWKLRVLLKEARRAQSAPLPVSFHRP